MARAGFYAIHNSEIRFGRDSVDADEADSVPSPSAFCFVEEMDERGCGKA
jgi:hypothetical protein